MVATALLLAAGLFVVEIPVHPQLEDQVSRFQDYKTRIKRSRALLRYYTFEEGYGEEVRNEAPAPADRTSLSGGPLGSLYILRNSPYGVSRKDYLHVLDDTPSPEWTAGRFPGKSALTNGLLQRCVFRSGFTGEGLDTFALSLWLRFHGGDQEGCDVLNIGNGGSSGFSLYYSKTGRNKTPALTFRMGVGAKPIYVGANPIDTGVWHHVVLVNTGHSLEMYLDGELSSAKDYTGAYKAPGQGIDLDNYLNGPYLESRDRGFLTIGGRPSSRSGSERFDIDEFAIYGRALPAGEVVQLYNSGKSGGSPEQQKAAFLAHQERKALLDQATMQIPSDTWGYFPSGKAIPATISLPANVARSLSAAGLKATFELYDLNGERIHQETSSLRSEGNTWAVATQLEPPGNGIYFLDIKLLDADGKLLKRLPEMYCLGVCPQPPVGKEATKDIPVGFLAVQDAWTYGMPLHLIYSHPVLGDPERQRQTTANLVKRVAMKRQLNPDMRVFLCAQFPWLKAITGEDRKSLEDYFSGVAAALQDEVWAWELATEPNGKISPELYMEIAKIASPIFRRITPGTPIAAAGASPGGLNFTKQILEMGLEELIDAVSFHSYVGAPIYAYNSKKSTGLSLRQIIDRSAKRPMPMWASESGILQLPRMGYREMTWDQALQCGYQAFSAPPERNTLKGGISTLPGASAAARQIQGILLDLAHGYKTFIKCQSPGMPALEQTNTEADPTLMGIALTNLSTRLSRMKQVTPMTLASVTDAGVIIERLDGSRDAVLFAEKPTTLSFKVPSSSSVKGLDMLGNLVEWGANRSGVVTLRVDQKPVYVLNVGPDFRIALE